MVRGRLGPRATAFACWLVAAAACLAIYWPGIFAWFQLDDFWWLSRLMSAQRGEGFWRAVLRTPDHGTYRPLSEPLFFMTVEYLFGFRALPFRLIVFATQLANCALLAALARRMTGSALGAFTAPLVWLAHSSLSMPMVWTSSYNQILGALFLLAELYLFARFADTGRRRFLVLDCVLLVVGFGVIETNVVHPAHAVAWALFIAPAERRGTLVKETLPLWALSGVFTVLHLLLVPRVGSYALGFRIGAQAGALADYWTWTIVPPQLLWDGARPWHRALAGTAALAVIAYITVRARAGERRPLFAWAFYLCSLGPYLLLAGQTAPSYLAIPTIGVALFFAGAVVSFGGGRIARVAAATVACVYLFFMVKTARAASASAAADSHAVERVVGGVLEIRRARHVPILFDEMTEYVYDRGFACRPFLHLQVADVYLSARAVAQLAPPAWAAPPAEYVADPALIARWRAEGNLLVLSAAGDRLRDVTATWQP